MRNLIAALLASTALLSQAAWAEEADAEAAAADTADEGEIVVFGQGETKQVQEVGARDIAVLLPGTVASESVALPPLSGGGSASDTLAVRLSSSQRLGRKASGCS